MPNENITFTASLGKDFEGKSNKKSRVLSALLSSVALGVFLEGCAKESEGGSSSLSSSSLSSSSLSSSSAATANAAALGNPASLVVSLEETPLEEAPLPAIVEVENWRGDTISLEVTTDASDEGDEVDDSLPLVLTDATLREITTDADDEVDEVDDSLPLVLTDATLREVTTDAGDEVDEVDDPFIGADRVTCWPIVDPSSDDNPFDGADIGADDILYGYGEHSGVANSYDDALGGTMLLRFYGHDYEAADFASDSDNFVRDGNDLVITVRDTEVTVKDAFDTNPDTGTDNSAFTINIEFFNENSFTPVTEAFWHSLA